VTWDILDACDYAVPQRRQRVVLLASRRGTPLIARKAYCRRTVRDAIGAISAGRRHSRDPLHNYRLHLSGKVRSLIRRIPRNGGSRRALGPQAQLACHGTFDGFSDVYGRLAWNRPSSTITSGCINPSKGRFLHPTANRPITLREAALLQTFPKSYSFPLDRGRYATALLIGNALPPEFIRRLASALRRVAVSGWPGGAIERA
jgi:DNA (cytosine-5)-methyltransferase 1